MHSEGDLGGVGDGDEGPNSEEHHSEGEESDKYLVSAADSDMEDEGDNDTEEAKRPKVRRCPMEPTKQERLEHEVTHLPYRSWCAHCIRGKAKEDPRPHKSEEKDEKESMTKYEEKSCSS